MGKMLKLFFTSILILCVGINKVACSEPACSKFHFEEQLLEKMIRMEFNVEKMKEEMTNMREVVKQELVSLQTERENFKTMFQTLNDEHNQERVLLQTQNDNMTKLFDDLKVEHKDAMSAQFKDMETVSKNQEALIMRMSEDLRILENNTVHKLTDLAATPVVAFRSRGIADITMTMSQIMIFTKTILNEGQGYDNKTGKFTAPVGGVYHFTSQLCTNPNNHVFYELIVNNEVQKRGAMYGYNSWSCHSVDAVVTMMTGTKAWLRCGTGTNSNVLYYREAYVWNMFSGVLVNKSN